MGMSFEIEEIIKIAVKAGEAILEVYSRDDFGTVMKNDKSPLTAADTAAHRLIVTCLEELKGDIPVLSEESKTIPYEDRKNWDRFWLVDPLDGTKEFLKRNGEFTVNIALIDGGAPVMGVVHAPVSQETHFAEAKKGKGALRRDASGKTEKIRVSSNAPGKMTVIVSRSHAGGEIQKLLDALGPFDSMSIGSSLKFCLIAEGKAQLYPRFWPSMEWDTAAGQCVVEEAGGTVADLKGKPLRYNKENLKNPFFVAGAFSPDTWLKHIGEEIPT